jgi:hypothetical protein
MKFRNQLKVKQQVKMSPTLKHGAAGTGLALAICVVMFLFANMGNSQNAVAKDTKPVEQITNIK